MAPGTSYLNLFLSDGIVEVWPSSSRKGLGADEGRKVGNRPQMLGEGVGTE